MNNIARIDRAKSDFSKVAVIGLGYIGLPTAALFSSRQVEVIGIDVNPVTVDTINKGEIHIIEPDLDEVVRHAVNKRLLQASTKVEAADAFLIAVPTPFKGRDRQPDLSYIQAAAHMIAPVLKKGDLVVLESTSPVGTTEKLAEWLAEERPDLRFPQGDDEDTDICVAYCPERVLPGKVMRELISNDRLIGGMTPHCSALATQLYKIFVEGECIATNARTAEMAKLTENSFRDVNIAFANELSLICDELDIDAWELIALANRHPRVEILKPGPGVGGHCIAVDPWFIVSRTPKLARLISTARQVNDEKPDWVIEKVKALVTDLLMQGDENSPKNVSIGCFGITFKPDIDDLRESPALYITRELARQFPGQVQAVEPNITVSDAAQFDFPVHTDMEKVKPFHINILLVPHHIFRTWKDDFSFVEFAR